MEQIDTHYYDGKIDISLLPKLIDLDNVDFRHIISYVKNNLHLFESKISDKAYQVLKIIVNDIGNTNNFNSFDLISVESLIYLCFEYIENSDFLVLLSEQLEQMLDGFCAQGRTHRIFQILLAYQD